MAATRIKKGSRVTGIAREVLRDDLVDRYVRQGKPIRAIAAETGRGYGTIHRMLAEAGVLRTQGRRCGKD